MSGDAKEGSPLDQSPDEGTGKAAEASPAKLAESSLLKRYSRDLQVARKADDQAARSLKRMEELAKKYTPGAVKNDRPAEGE